MTHDDENPAPIDHAASPSRYSRQVLFRPVGRDGQERIAASQVVIIGCGALGSHLANALVRAGVGRVRIVDRDVIELHNLHRQILFDEDDVAAELPKAEAARRKLARINRDVTVEAVVADATPANIDFLANGADLILDGTDNFETRFLINDLAIKTRRPWIYGACAAARGLAMAILPGETPCLRCVFEQAPPPELNPTCDTVGILGPIVSLIAAHQSMEAIKILSGHPEAVDRRLWSFEGWPTRITPINVARAADQADCPCCKRQRFEYLEGKHSRRTAVLCGNDAVQFTPPEPVPVDLERLAERLRRIADEPPQVNTFLIRACVEGHTVRIFADGRVMIRGMKDEKEARSFYDRYIGA